MLNLWQRVLNVPTRVVHRHHLYPLARHPFIHPVCEPSAPGAEVKDCHYLLQQILGLGQVGGV